MTPTHCPCGSPADPAQIELAATFPRLIPQPRCGACQDTLAHQENTAADKRNALREEERRHDRYHRTIPPALRDTHLAHPTFNKSLYIRTADWQPGRRWLGIVGEPGASKTRILSLIAKRLILEGKYVTWINLPSFQTLTEILRCGSDRERQDTLRTLAKMKTADLIVLDDIGKNTWNPSIERHLFEIIDHRATHYLPILWSANTHPVKLLNSGDLSTDRAAPLIGRIIENSRIEIA